MVQSVRPSAEMGDGSKSKWDILLINGLGGEAHGAEAVEDGNLKAAHFGETRVHVERTVGFMRRICVSAVFHPMTVHSEGPAL